jgi:hypothetical protein
MRFSGLRTLVKTQRMQELEKHANRRLIRDSIYAAHLKTLNPMRRSYLHSNSIMRKHGKTRNFRHVESPGLGDFRYGKIPNS